MWWSQLLVLCLSVVLANALNTGHHYDLVLQKQNINENNDVVDVHATTSKIWSSKVVKTCKIRGGKTTVRSDIVSKLNLQLVSFLKTIIPKGWWPRSWKTKNNNSRTMSKEHLEKSFTKGDSNCRIQKVFHHRLLSVYEFIILPNISDPLPPFYLWHHAY